MRSRINGLPRFRSRREAERALAEIIEDGGVPCDFRIDEARDGSCIIVVLETNGEIAGQLGV